MKTFNPTYSYRAQLLGSAMPTLDDEPVVLPPKEPTILSDPPKEEPAKEEPAKEEPAKEEPKAEPKEEPKEEPAKVPETYELKAPEGQGDLDPEAVAQATPVFKELGLTNEQAQKVVDLYAGKVLPAVAQTVQGETLRLLGMADIGKWAEMVKADKELGGADYEKNLTIVAAGRDALATPELRAFFEESRIGNHPEVVRLFYKIGKAVGEGQIAPNSAPNTGAKPGEINPQSFYGPEFQAKS